jgi:TolB-like protein
MRKTIAYTVAAWLLIQVTDIVFPRIGLPDSAVTLVIALLAIGFVPALIFAWAFEMTPEGIKREKDVDRTQSITPQTGRKLDRVIILVLAVVVAWFLIDEYYLEPQQMDVSTAEVTPAVDEAVESTDMAKSIAVLPFVNMSADAENEYFSDGISEELLNVLVKVSTLHVASRTSSFSYKGKDTPISQIATELKVDNILEGSVRKAGNRVRITAQLINANSDRHIWSETYERELDDIFDIQEEISGSIVAALKVALNVEEKSAIDRGVRPTENTEAYELYLQGRFAWRQRQEENIRKSIDLFNQAIALDPDFARAWEALAVAWAVLPSWSDTSNAEASSQAKPAAINALQLDPALSEARAVLAEVAFDNHRWADGIEQYRQAINSDPRNPTLNQWLGEAFGYLGFNAQALEHLQVAYELDPTSPVINQSMVWMASANRKDDLALKHAAITRTLGLPDRALFNSWESLVRKGEWDTILEWLESQDQLPPIAISCFRARQDPAVMEQLPALVDAYLSDHGDEDRNGWLTPCLTQVGQVERAASMVLQPVKDNWQVINQFWLSDPAAGLLRQSNAFRQALGDMGLLDFYRQFGWPDQCRPLGDEDFVCDQ